MKFTIFLTTLIFTCLGVSTSSFAQCKIGALSVKENSINPSNVCEICISAKNKFAYSDVVCEPLQNIDAQCQVNTCSPFSGCSAAQLPKHTRCTDPICSKGEISQMECSSEGKCETTRTRNCRGFACLDAKSCASSCKDKEDCESPAICENKVCKIPDSSTDMGTQDMGKDMGKDVKVGDGGKDLDMSDTSKDLSDATISDRSDTSTIAVAGAGGCSATSTSPSWFLLFLAFIGVSRRRS